MNRQRRQNSRKNPRDERWFQPAFGVVHRVHHSIELDNFFSDLRKQTTEFPNVEVFDQSKRASVERPAVTFFNPLRLSLRIVERRFTEGYGKKNRYIWHPGDKARIQQNIADIRGKYDIGGEDIEAELCRVVRMGDPKAAKNGGRVLALVPEANSHEADFFASENELAVNGIRHAVIGTSNERRESNDAPYLPHISIGTVRREASLETVGQVVDTIQAMLPLAVLLGEAEFTPRKR